MAKTLPPLLVLVLLCLVGCPSKPPLLLPNASDQENACKILEYYACESAKPNVRGETCIERFKRVEDNGYMPHRSTCVVQNSDSLDSVRSCGVECKLGHEP